VGVDPSVGSIVTISKDVGSNDSGTGAGTGGPVVPDSVGAGVSMGTQSGGVGALFSALVDDPLEDPPLEDPPLEDPPLEEPPLLEDPDDDSPLSDLELEILEVSDPALPLLDEVMPAGQMLSTSTHFSALVLLTLLLSPLELLTPLSLPPLLELPLLLEPPLLPLPLLPLPLLTDSPLLLLPPLLTLLPLDDPLDDDPPLLEDPPPSGASATMPASPVLPPQLASFNTRRAFIRRPPVPFSALELVLSEEVDDDSLLLLELVVTVTDVVSQS